MTPAVKEMEEGDAPSSDLAGAAVCIFCCFSFNPQGSPVSVESNSEQDSDDLRQSNVDQDLIVGNRELFDKFVKEVVVLEGKKGVISKLAGSVCEECLESVRRSVEARVKAGEVERKTRRVQRQILKLMRELDNCLGECHNELKWIQRQIGNSDLACLENCVKEGVYPREVLLLREKIGEVVEDCTQFRLNLEAKIDVKVLPRDTTSGNGFMGRVAKKSSSGRDKNEPPQPLSKGVSKNAKTSKRKPISAPSTPVVARGKEDKKRNVSVTPTKKGSSPRKRKLIKDYEKKDQSDNQAEDVIDDGGMEEEAPTVPLKNSQSPNKNTRQRDTAARYQKDARPMPPKRGRKAGPATASTSASRSQVNFNCSVRLQRLTMEEISKMKEDLKSEKPVAVESSKSPKVKKIVKRVITFDPDDSDSEDEELSESEEDERDSLISYVNKLPLNRASPWKRRIIVGLLGRMKYEINKKEKEGLPQPKHLFQYNKTKHVFLFGKVPLTFHDNQGVQCGKCDYKTSHNETCFFNEITNHILKQHLATDTCSTVTSSTTKRKNLEAGWNPEWEDSDNSDEEEEEEVQIIATASGRPQRQRKVPARFYQEEENDVEKERSGGEEWTPPSSSSLFQPIEKPDTPVSKPAVPPIRNRRGQMNSDGDTTAGPSSSTKPPKPSSQKKKIIDLIIKWNTGKEGKSALALWKKKNVKNESISEICSWNQLTEEISVLNVPILFNESSCTLECSRCDHVTPPLFDKEDDLKQQLEKIEKSSANRDIILHVLGSHLSALDCPTCGKRFTTPASVQIHSKEHQNEVEEPKKQVEANKEPEKMNGTETRKKISRFSEPEEETRQISLKGRRNWSESESSSSSSSEEEDDSVDLLDV